MSVDTTASIEVGDPGFPELSGKETGAEIVWRMDTQDSPVVPSRGTRSNVRLSRIFDGPDIDVNGQTVDYASSLTQLSGTANRFWSVGPRNRVFLYGGLGHVLRRRAAADRSVRAGHALPARRL